MSSAASVIIPDNVLVTDTLDHHMADTAVAPQLVSEGEWTAKIEVPYELSLPPIPVPTNPTTPSQPPTQPPTFMLGPGTTLKASQHPTLDINDLLLALVDLQQRKPEEIHRITTLELDGQHPIICRSLQRGVEGLKLPKLRELVIHGAAMLPETLRKFLFNHKSTLCRLKIENTALTIPEDDIFNGYDAWIGLLEVMRHGLNKIQHLQMGRLFWRWQAPSPHSPSNPSSRVHSKLVLPQRKYHRRVQKSWDGKPVQWRLELDGMWAEEQVYDALGAFSRELKKIRDEEKHV